MRNIYVSDSTRDFFYVGSFSRLDGRHGFGLEKNPHTEKYEKDLDVARFNIDMLQLLKDKTKNNLDAEEKQFLDQIISDLQMHFVSVTKENKQ